VKRLGVSEQNSVVERSSLPPRKGNGGEDRRPPIFARDRQSGICSSCYVEAAMTEKAAPPRQVWHEKSEAMRHNNGPDGKRPQKIEAK